MSKESLGLVKALLTRKLGMTSLVTEDGTVVPITLLSASPNVVVQIKTNDVDGYQAMQIGFETAKNPFKAQVGHSKKAKLANAPKVTREIRINEIAEDQSVGTEIKADVFSVGDKVHASGISKGKGFAGTIKRHNFKRGRKTHGGRSYRRPGSIGSMYPQRIFKGKRMAGRLGADKTTVQNLKVALVDTELNVIGVSGAIPGPKNSIVTIVEAK